MQPQEYVAAARSEGALLHEAFDGPLDATVPSCPGWTLADLLDHLGTVCSFWGAMVADPDLDPGSVTSPPTTTLGELDRRLAELFGLLDGADPDRPCWTYAEPHTVGFVQRRIANELGVHRWDAQLARGAPEPIPLAMAVDGIDEFITTNLAHRPAPATDVVGGSVHLHPHDADGGGEWEIIPATAGSPSMFELRPGHAKADAAVRGTASDLLLALWGRSPVDLEVLGDAGVAERFFAAL